jgi:exonuclease III
VAIITLNVEGVTSNMAYIRSTIDEHDPEIICLQETWLFNFEQSKLADIHPMFCYAAKSVDDNDHISPKQRPRGYGGVATLWKKTLPVSPQPDGSERTLAVMLGVKTVIVNSYLPCRGNHTIDEFTDEVDQLDEICSKFSKSKIVMAGDLNVDVKKHSGTRVNYIKELFAVHNLREHSLILEPTFRHHDSQASSKISEHISRL